MKLINQIRVVLNKPFFSDYRTLMVLWLILPVIAGLIKLEKHTNFVMYRYAFLHLTELSTLYATCKEYADVNHYGPFLGVVMAPFAVVPEKVGLMLWLIALSASLFFAIRKLMMRKQQQIFIYWFCAFELLAVLLMQQFSVALTAIIIATYYFADDEDDFWAAFFIVLGTMIDFRGIVGLAFILFSKDRVKFLFFVVVWAALLLALTMVLTDPEYIVSQYLEWWRELTTQGTETVLAGMQVQSGSLLAMIRNVTQCATYSDLWIVAGGLILFFLPYFRVKQYYYSAFRFTLLASVLIFVVLFSPGNESGLSVIALVGVAIWYVAAPWKRSKADVALLVFTYVVTVVLSAGLRLRLFSLECIPPYLSAFPYVLVWLKLCYEICRRSYARLDIQNYWKQ